MQPPPHRKSSSNQHVPEDDLNLGAVGGAYLQPSSLRCEIRIVLEDLLIDLLSGLLAQGVYKRGPKIRIMTLFVDFIDHLSCPSQPNDIHPQAGNLLGDFIRRGILQTLRDHGVQAPGPVDPGVMDFLPSTVVDFDSRRVERCVRPRIAVTAPARTFGMGGAAGSQQTDE